MSRPPRPFDPPCPGAGIVSPPDHPFVQARMKSSNFVRVVRFGMQSGFGQPQLYPVDLQLFLTPSSLPAARAVRDRSSKTGTGDQRLCQKDLAKLLHRACAGLIPRGSRLPVVSSIPVPDQRVAIADATDRSGMIRVCAGRPADPWERVDLLCLAPTW